MHSFGLWCITPDAAGTSSIMEEDVAVARRDAQADNDNSSTDANHRGVSVMPHGHPQEGPVMVTAYCPRHGRSSYPCGDDGSSSPEYTRATPPNSPTPATSPELLLRGLIDARHGAPFFNMTAGNSSSIALATPPPPPPPASSTAGRPTATAAANACLGHRPTAAAAANACLGLRHRIIKPGMS